MSEHDVRGPMERYLMGVVESKDTTVKSKETPRPKQAGAQVARNGLGDWSYRASTTSVFSCDIMRVEFKDDEVSISMPADPEILSADAFKSLLEAMDDARCRHLMAMNATRRNEPPAMAAAPTAAVAAHATKAAGTGTTKAQVAAERPRGDAAPPASMPAVSSVSFVDDDGRRLSPVESPDIGWTPAMTPPMRPVSFTSDDGLAAAADDAAADFMSSLPGGNGVDHSIGASATAASIERPAAGNTAVRTGQWGREEQFNISRMILVEGKTAEEISAIVGNRSPGAIIHRVYSNKLLGLDNKSEAFRKLRHRFFGNQKGQNRPDDGAAAEPAESQTGPTTKPKHRRWKEDEEVRARGRILDGWPAEHVAADIGRDVQILKWKLRGSGLAGLTSRSPEFLAVRDSFYGLHRPKNAAQGSLAI